jgi:Ca-activated chloride channel family protein
LNALPNQLAEIRLAAPAWLALWPVAMAVLALLARGARLDAFHALPRAFSSRRYRHPLVASLRTLQGSAVEAGSRRVAYRRALLHGVVLTGAVVALAQPYRQGEELPKPPLVRDTVFIVDSSISMGLRDYIVDGERVDRITMLRGVMAHFIGALRGNRIGLVAFSETPYTLVPLTTDYAFLQHMVRRLQPAVLTGSMSDVSKALLYTAQQLRGNAEQASSERPVLVLVTDVNRPVRDIDPRAAARYLAAEGYRLHVIAVGAAGYQADEKAIASLVYHPVNFPLLKEIAGAAGGRFFWARDAASLKAAMNVIEQAERRAIDAPPRYVAIPLYHWPLGGSLALALLAQLWPARRVRS